MEYRNVDRVRARAWMMAVGCAVSVAACSGNDNSSGAGTNTRSNSAGSAASPAASMINTAGRGSVAGGAVNPSTMSMGVAGRAASTPTNTTTPTTPTTPITPSMNTTPGMTTAPTMPPPATTGMMPAAGAAGAAAPSAPPGMMPVPNADPEDGDASKPMFTNPDFACRQATGGGFGLSQPNFKVDNRDVIIDYPCNKHEGAPMTFILNLHGTTPVEQHFYQEGYFSAWQFVASHNLIVATPSSVVQQWGNMDMGQDEPYLMDVIAYVYKAFGAFDIKQMWVGGHSWGAFYTAQFGCKAELADKVKGLIIMSGASTLPSCASKMSVLNTVAEMDIGPAIDFQTLPMQHGCGSEMSAMLGNNEETFWPMCTAPFVHAKYKMLGKMHADFMDKEVVQSLVDWIKISRQAQK